MYNYDEYTFSDFHKATYGFRPHGDHRFYTTNDPDVKQLLWDQLGEAFTENEKEEAEREMVAVHTFNNKLEELQKFGAKDRKEAMRWYMTSVGFDDFDKAYGASYACYSLGLPRSMKSEFETFFKGAK